MNTKLIHSLLGAVVTTAIIGAASSVQAASYVIGLAPDYSPPDRKIVLQETLLFVLEGAAPGDVIDVYDALNLKPVTRFDIPEGGLFRNNARARAQKLVAPISTLRRFILAEHATGPDMIGVINLPEFLDLAGPQLRSPGQPLRVILVGSPFHTNPMLPSFNMDDAYPSDAHLKADQSLSVFGTALRQRRLAGVTVHYACLQEERFINDYHRERIMRFWSLFIGQQQGVLATFAPDVSLAFRRAGEGTAQPVVSAELDEADDKIQMLPVHRHPVPRWLAPATEEEGTGPVSLEIVPAVETLPNPIRTIDLPVQTTHGQIGIGIMWSAPVDCDLWVQAKPGAKDLYFQNRSTPDGRYFHDYRTGNQGVDYEYVELNPTDLRSVKAWVNLFEGQSDAISGIVVVRLNGQSHRGEFHLRGTRGNRARDRNRREQSPCWTELDLLQIVGLPQGTAAAGNPQPR